MKLTVGTFVTLDGVMQAPGGPEEDLSAGFTHGGWVVPFFDDMMLQVMIDWIQDADGLLLGRKTYEIFAAHSPHVANDDPIGVKFNSVRKYVVSRTLDRVDWNNSTLIKGIWWRGSGDSNVNRETSSKFTAAASSYRLCSNTISSTPSVCGSFRYCLGRGRGYSRAAPCRPGSP